MTIFRPLPLSVCLLFSVGTLVALVLAGCDDAGVSPPSAEPATPNAVATDEPDRPSPDPVEPATLKVASHKETTTESETVNLLAWIDPSRDTVTGQWRKEDGALISPGTVGARLVIPCTVPDAYRLKVVVERVGGDEMFGIGLVAGGRRFMANFDSHFEDRISSGLELVDGRRIPENSTTHLGRIFHEGEPTTIVARVTKGHVRVTADGEELVDYEGPLKNLSPPPGWEVPGEGKLFLASWMCRYRISELELTPLSGEAPTLAAVSKAPEKPSPDTPVNGKVTLTDGTVLDVETWEETYEAYTWRQPMSGKDWPVKTVMKLPASRSVVDFIGKTVYWFEKHRRKTLRGVQEGERIMCADWDGRHRRQLVAGLEQGRGLSVDPRRKKIYWLGRRTGSVTWEVWAANADGGNVKSLAVVGRHPPTATAVDLTTGDVYYAGSYGGKILRIDPDTGKETLIADIEGWGVHWLKVYGARGVMFFVTSGTAYSGLWRCRLDGDTAERLFDFGGGSVAIDWQTEKVYWMGRYRDGAVLRRANLDGTHREEILVWPHNVSGWVAIKDSQSQGHRVLYFQDKIYHQDQGDHDYFIHRTPLPPPLRNPESKPAPPLVTQIEPLQAKAGEEITLLGRGFDGTKHVLFIDRGTGANVAAEFKIYSDNRLTVTVPRLETIDQPVPIIVRANGALTVTLPKNPHVVGREDKNFTVKFKRFVTDASLPYWVIGEPKREPGFVVGLRHVEGCVVFATPYARVDAGTRGGNTFFLKNGSYIRASTCVNGTLYHEPFAMINYRANIPPAAFLIPVSAIRPSFVKELFQYQPSEIRP